MAAFDVEPGDPRPLTLTGGLPYFGGPGRLVRAARHRLRRASAAARPTTSSPSGALGGFVDDFGVGLYSRAEPERGRSPAATRCARRPSGVVIARTGDEVAEVIAATVLHDRDGGPVAAPVIVRLADGSRLGARAADPSIAAEVERHHPRRPPGASPPRRRRGRLAPHLTRGGACPACVARPCRRLWARWGPETEPERARSADDDVSGRGGTWKLNPSAPSRSAGGGGWGVDELEGGPAEREGAAARDRRPTGRRGGRASGRPGWFRRGPRRSGGRCRTLRPRARPSRWSRTSARPGRVGRRSVPRLNVAPRAAGPRSRR